MSDPFFSQTVRSRGDGADEKIQSKIVGSANSTLADAATHQAKVDADGLHVVVDNLPSSVPTVLNVSIPLANTEVSQVLTGTVKKLLIRARAITTTQFSFVSGDSGALFVTIPAGACLTLDDLSLNSATIYIQCNKASQVVEILKWT